VIYDHLPDELTMLKAQRKPTLAKFALEIGFEAHARVTGLLARSAMLRAIRHQPAWLANRGVLSILLRSLSA
jgi:hypothetical protein